MESLMVRSGGRGLVSLCLLAAGVLLAAAAPGFAQGDLETRCREYAAEAVCQQAENLQWQCGYTGGGWHTDFERHLRWCRGASKDSVAKEARDRTELLGRCSHHHPEEPGGGGPCGVTAVGSTGAAVCQWHSFTNDLRAFVEMPGNVCGIGNYPPGQYYVLVGPSGSDGMSVPPARWNTYGPYTFAAHDKWMAVMGGQSKLDVMEKNVGALLPYSDPGKMASLFARNNDVIQWNAICVISANLYDPTGGGTGGGKAEPTTPVPGSAVENNTAETVTLAGLKISGATTIRLFISELSGLTASGSSDSARVGEVEFYAGGQRVMPASVEAESVFGSGYTEEQASDGEREYRYMTQGAKGWASAHKGPNETSWLDFTFAKPVSVDKVVVTTAPSDPYRLGAFELRVSSR